MQSVQALASSLLGVFSEVLTALPDHTAPPCSFLLGRAALSAASSGLASVPYPGCDEVEDRAVYISLALCPNFIPGHLRVEEWDFQTFKRFGDLS